MLFCHTYRFTCCLLLWALVLILPGPGRPSLGAQEADESLSGAGEAALPVSPRPAERDILLGESGPGLVAAETGPVSGFVILRTVLLLILAAAAVYGVVYVVKKLSQPRDTLNPNLRLLGTLRLGPGRFVHVVALGTRAWLVGAGEGGISHIADVTEQEALDTLFLDESRRNGASGRAGDFRSLLRRLGVLKPEPGASPGEDEGRDDLAENIRRRGDRLRGL